MVWTYGKAVVVYRTRARCITGLFSSRAFAGPRTMRQLLPSVHQLPERQDADRPGDRRSRRRLDRRQRQRPRPAPRSGKTRLVLTYISSTCCVTFTFSPVGYRFIVSYTYAHVRNHHLRKAGPALSPVTYDVTRQVLVLNAFSSRRSATPSIIFRVSIYDSFFALPPVIIYLSIPVRPAAFGHGRPFFNSFNILTSASITPLNNTVDPWRRRHSCRRGLSYTARAIESAHTQVNRRVERSAQDKIVAPASHA